MFEWMAAVVHTKKCSYRDGILVWIVDPTHHVVPSRPTRKPSLSVLDFHMDRLQSDPQKRHNKIHTCVSLTKADRRRVRFPCPLRRIIWVPSSSEMLSISDLGGS
eukprot:scaffold574_cov333-Pavlova_lutheri.AAC.44